MPLLDTSFVIDFLRGDERAARLMRLLQQGSAPLGLSALSHFELYRGVGRSSRPAEERRRIEDFLRALAVFPLEAEAAKQAGLLRAELEQRGTAVDLIDLLVGCTAVHHGEDIVTRNAKHFQRIPGLQVLLY